jgi:L-lactate dehydrogenase complex protein LldG
MTTESSNHRSRILAGIRISLGTADSADTIAAEYAAIPRTYTRSSDADRHTLLELFTERLVEYDAGVYRTAPNGIANLIAEILKRRAKAGLAIPAGLPSAWLPDGFNFEVAQGFDAYQLDSTSGILTGCTVAIAETGSIVLQNANAQGARILSLVPDYHLCVVFASQVVATVPEAFTRLARTSALPTTFISGPSATADIEMTRIKGVHGPRFLDIILVDD